MEKISPQRKQKYITMKLRQRITYQLAKDLNFSDTRAF